MEDLRACYAVLELDEGASPETVDRAYRELSRVWHPDRFVGDYTVLQLRALHKQQQINVAYERLVTAREQTSSAAITAPDQSLAGQSSGVTTPAASSVAAPTLRSAMSQVGHLVVDHLIPALRTTVIPAILRQLTSERGDAGRTSDGSPRPRRQRPRDGRGAGRGPGRGQGGRGRRR